MLAGRTPCRPTGPSTRGRFLLPAWPYRNVGDTSLERFMEHCNPWCLICIGILLGSFKENCWQNRLNICHLRNHVLNAKCQQLCCCMVDGKKRGLEKKSNHLGTAPHPLSGKVEHPGCRFVGPWWILRSPLRISWPWQSLPILTLMDPMAVGLAGSNEFFTFSGTLFDD